MSHAFGARVILPITREAGVPFIHTQISLLRTCGHIGHYKLGCVSRAQEPSSTRAVLRVPGPQVVGAPISATGVWFCG